MSRYSGKQTFVDTAWPGIQQANVSDPLGPVQISADALWNLPCSRMFSAEVGPKSWRSWRDFQGIRWHFNYRPSHNQGWSCDNQVTEAVGEMMGEEFEAKPREATAEMYRDSLYWPCTNTWKNQAWPYKGRGCAKDGKTQWCGSSSKTGRLSQLLVKVSKQTFGTVWTAKTTHPQGRWVELVNWEKESLWKCEASCYFSSSSAIFQFQWTCWRLGRRFCQWYRICAYAEWSTSQPVSYSSRALTTSERNYSQIEKELLAQVFGVECNHQYVYGQKVVLWLDHKPLETTSKKPLATAPKRLQRLLLRLQQYDVEIHYKPGPEMYLADI